MTDVLVHNAIAEENKKFRDRIESEFQDALIDGLLEEPMRYIDYWHCIPLIKTNNANAVLCVHTSQDASFNAHWNCGASCTWTVPDGVTCAQFQLWGPGAPGGAISCCGVSPFGATGTYSTMAIPVCPGEQYYLYAGCTCCCSRCQGHQCYGESSYVSGPGLHNFCTYPGEQNLLCMYMNSGYMDYCQLKCCPPMCLCWCQFWCMAQICPGIHIPMPCGVNAGYGTSTRLNSSKLYSIPSMGSTIEVKSCYCYYDACAVYICNSPIIGLDHNACSNSCVVFGYPYTNTGFRTCQGGCGYRMSASSNIEAYYANIAGMGGWAGYSCSTGCQCSDIGQGGMIRVTWC